MVSSENQELNPLEYGCSKWRRSSQIASNLFNDGSKLWTKNDLRDIEQQLAQSNNRKIFTVRSIDGTVVSIKNHMFGERLPIWWADNNNHAPRASLTLSIIQAAAR
jgi:hypothetical protein